MKRTSSSTQPPAKKQKLLESSKQAAKPTGSGPSTPKTAALPKFSSSSSSGKAGGGTKPSSNASAALPTFQKKSSATADSSLTTTTTTDTTSTSTDMTPKTPTTQNKKLLSKKPTHSNTKQPQTPKTPRQAKPESTSAAVDPPKTLSTVKVEFCSKPAIMAAHFMRNVPPATLFTDPSTTASHYLPIDDSDTNTPSRLEIDTDNIRHVGDQDMGTQHFVGVFNKESNSVTFLPAYLFSLNQEVKDFNSDLMPEIGDSKSRTREDLISVFSGAKQHRKFMARKEDSIQASHIKEGADNDMIIEKKASTPAPPPSTHASLPPYDLSAKAPQDIYDLDDIFGTEEELALQSDKVFYHAVKSGGIPEITASNTVKNALSQISTDTSGEKKRLCLAARYLHFLVLFLQTFKKENLKFKRIPYKELTGKIPETLVNLICDKFCEKKGSRSCLLKAGEVKLINFILILGLMLTDYQLPSALTAEDLRLPLSGLNVHWKSIGCKAGPPAEGYYYLSAPLKLATQKRRTKKKH